MSNIILGLMISACFLLVFGLNGILQHFDGDDNFSMMREQEQMMKAPLMPFGGEQGKDWDKILSSEKENLEIIPFFSILDEAPDKLIEKYQYVLDKN